jgi:tetratricopeptide (TPR) repeat protein
MVDEDLGDVLKELQRNHAIDWKNIGNDFLKRGDYENAIKSYKSALDIDSNYIDAWNNLGLAYIKVGKIDEAKKCHETIDSLKKTQTIVPETKSNLKKVQIPPIPTNSSIKIPTDISLSEGETPIWSGNMSWAANWAFILLAILFIWTIILPIIFIIIAYINVSTSEYFVSNRRVYIKYGWIRRAINDLKLDWITNVSISQGFFGRIINFGTVLIATPGTYTGTSGFVGVSDPMKIRGIIDSQIQIYKKN